MNIYADLTPPRRDTAHERIQAATAIGIAFCLCGFAAITLATVAIWWSQL